MKKPQDNDIFGTKNIQYAPRIHNDSYVDPNAQFQARMDAQYDQYSHGLKGRKATFSTGMEGKGTMVNERVEFDENYHRWKKDVEMQSTIFSERQSTISESRLTNCDKLTQRVVPKHSPTSPEKSYGRKETLSRQVTSRPENNTHFKGNCSSVFGYNQMADRNQTKNKVDKLIPSKMEWEQYDSIRYCAKNDENLVQSQIVPEEQIQMMKKKDMEESPVLEIKQNIKESQNKPKPEKVQKPSTNVQILLLKGWTHVLLEPLAKYCKLNSTKILSVNFQEGGKGKLTLSKSKRWDVVADWLRKDQGVRIRVL